MKYIKLIALPETWFKEGTEVFFNSFNDYQKNNPDKKLTFEEYRLYGFENDLDIKRRLTLEEFEFYKPQMGGVSDFVGIRVVQNSGAEAGLPLGMEREDCEFCSWDEFKTIIFDDQCS